MTLAMVGETLAGCFFPVMGIARISLLNNEITEVHKVQK
jgi:hypothetical protein